MTWISHEVGAVSLVLAFGLSPAAYVPAFFGGIAPDFIDQFISRLAASDKTAQKRIFARLHRGTSHWFGLYLGLLMVVTTMDLPQYLASALTGFALGALSHVALDLLTPRGVPLLPGFRQHLALPLVKTGGISEYLLLFSSCLLGGIVYGEKLWQGAVQRLMLLF